MAAVAAKTGLSRSTVHRCFSTRQGLARALETWDGHESNSPRGQARARYAGSPARGQGRRRLLDAARDVFERKGYADASIREIADRAGVSQPIVYRHFESKAALFEEAAVVPLNDFLMGYAAQATSRPPAEQSFLDQAREFCGSLYDVLAHERDLLLTMLTVRRFTDVMGQGKDPFHRAVQRCLNLMTETLEKEAKQRQLRSFDSALVSRLVFGMTLSAALHDDWLLAGRYTREQLVEEMADLLIHGVGVASRD
jgi:AcrR family transcriptional regulator